MNKTVVEQIEAAYREGWQDGSCASDGSSHYEDLDWRQSNARRAADAASAASAARLERAEELLLEARWAIKSYQIPTSITPEIDAFLRGD